MYILFYYLCVSLNLFMSENTENLKILNLVFALFKTV